MGGKGRSRGTSAVDKHVGARIRALRLMRGMSQTDLANELELTFQQVQKYEKGSNRVSAGKLLEIAKIVEVPIAVFFEGVAGAMGPSSGADATIAQHDSFMSSRDGVALSRAFSSISSAAMRRSIVELAEHIAAFERRHAGGASDNGRRVARG